MNSDIVFQIKTAVIVFGYFLCLAIPVVVIIGSAIYNLKPSDIERGDEEISDFQEEQT